MQRLTAILVVGILVVTAGCSGGIPFIDGDQRTGATPQGTVTETRQSTTEQSSLKYPKSTDTGEIVLSLADFSGSYNFTSESLKNRPDLNASERNEWKERGVLREHRKIFTLGDREVFGEKPVIIISSAILYVSSEKARKASPDTLSALEESGANLSQVELPSGYTATKAVGETDSGNKNTMFYLRDRNMVIWLLTSGENYYREETKQLFIKMIADLK